MNSIYPTNKGVNKPVVFRGLQGQYIWWPGGGLAVLLVVFALLYMAGLPMYLCLGLIIPGGAILFTLVYRLNGKYGEHGLMKMLARRQMPTGLRSDGFIGLQSKDK
jgi:hypothetical protein